MDDKCADLVSQNFSSSSLAIQRALKKIFFASDYAKCHIDVLKVAVNSFEEQYKFSDYQCLAQEISHDLQLASFSEAIRTLRHCQFLRLMLREALGLADIIETMRSWSDFADSIILHTLDYCKEQASSRYGMPIDKNGIPVELYTIAMGKLGGQELNYSSDIDLIFVYGATGMTSGEKSISNQEFYTKVIQQFIKLLQTATPNGFVFRVDLRLRPNGAIGPLLMNVVATETYYQELGRDWERYAMVKARLITSNKISILWFERLQNSFVYRRYVDFSVLESLRSMKAMIAHEIKLNPKLDDIKRGNGGIREIEFIIQCFQLIRGGRLLVLQNTNAIKALNAISYEGLLANADKLHDAYLFLRKVENSLQAINDQQTHALPQDEHQQAQLTCALGGKSWGELEHQLKKHQHNVGCAFKKILSENNNYQDDEKLLLLQLKSLWQGNLEPTMAANLLASVNFKEPERCYQLIHGFRHSPRCQRLSQVARMRLDSFMVMLLKALAKVENTSDVLTKVISLLEAIVGRSTYLALLTENVVVLEELLYLFSQSSFISLLLISQPFLLEVLIDQKVFWQPPLLKILKEKLTLKISMCASHEEASEVLRQFKLINILCAARAELYGFCDSEGLSKFLAYLAEVIIDAVVDIAYQRLEERFNIPSIRNKFAVLAYGKLGSVEMNYDSDLDLVFLHSAKDSDVVYIQRLAQKIIRLLTTRTATGILYEVDTRLRPSGSAGLLVSHIDAFVKYQSENAWVWEHQALLKARMLIAPQGMRKLFKELLHFVLTIKRDRQELIKAVSDIRAKMRKQPQGIDAKSGLGGLIDLEFLVQFLILANHLDDMVFNTNTLSQVQQLHKHKVLSVKQYAIVEPALREFHIALHQHTLGLEVLDTKGVREKVIKICHDFGLYTGQNH